MKEIDLLWMSALIFLPTLFALGLVFFPRGKDEAMRWWTLAGTALTLGVSLLIFIDWYREVIEHHAANQELASLNARGSAVTNAAVGSVDTIKGTDWVGRLGWIPRFNIHYFLGLDGISMAMVLLTTLLCFLAMIASWGIEKHVRGYCMLFLILETGILGTFLALDFFLFYVFWEVMLLPMYFLIGIWGGPRREYAAIKFFLYTLLGSVLILIAMLAFYFTNTRDYVNQERLTEVAKQIQGRSGIPGRSGISLEEAAHARGHHQRGAGIPGRSGISLEEAKDSAGHTFDILTLQEVGKTALAYLSTGDVNQVSNEGIRAAQAAVKEAQKGGTPESVKAAEAALQAARDRVTSQPFFQPWFQITMFVLLFIGFAIKLPMFPFHTWLPDAHVEAPTPISMILAGILLKLGGYGIIRIAYPICPWAAMTLAWWLSLFGIINIVYGAFAAMAQNDFKKLVAYSSISHMGYVILGVSVWAAGVGAEAWKFGMNGAMYQMIGHGISSAGMFFLVGVIYDRAHHRNLNNFRGLAEPMPLYAGMSAIVFFAAMGLPGLCGFIGEIYVVLATWQFDKVFAVLAALTVVLTAAYILWTLQRVYMGTNAAYKGYSDMNLREVICAVPLVVFAVLLGVLPQQLVFDWMEPSVSRLVDTLTNLVP